MAVITAYDDEGYPAIRPQEGPQWDFCSTTADIAFYGGMAMGGKSFALLIEGGRGVPDPNYTGVIFRRKYVEITQGGGLWDTSENIYPSLGGVGIKGNTEWRFPSGCKIKMTHLNNEENKKDHQGAQYTYMGFDELTHFTKSQFFYLMSRNRSPAGCTLKPYIRATFNAEPGWVADLIAWYWDPETGYPIPERSGVIRYFVRRNDDVVWVSKEYRDESGLPPKSFTFISSAMEDNPLGMLANPDYKATINSLDHVTRERLGKSNFLIQEGGNMFKPEWFEVVDSAPAGMKMIRYWDFAATEVSEKDKNDPDWTAGALCGIWDHTLYIVDVIYHRETPGQTELTLINTASQDGRDVEIWWEEEKGSAGKFTSHYLRSTFKGYDAHPDPVSGQKTDRAKPWSAWAEFGRVKLVRGAWNRQFLSWASSFPDGKRDVIDACFVAGTMVSTIYGLKPIENIVWGDLILTPIGFRKVLNLYRHESDVIDCGCFVCTPNHPVYSNGEYINADALTGLSKISILTLKELISWNIQNQLFLMGELTGCSEGHSRITILRSTQSFQENTNPLKVFMLQFGSFIQEKKFLMAMLFITKTVIALITATKIWSAYHGMNTVKSMVYMIKRVWTNRRCCLIKLDHLLKSGTNQKKGISGTRIMVRKFLILFHTKMLSVLSAGNCLNQKKILSFVQTIVGISIEESIITKQLKKRANTAVKNLKQNTLKESQEDFALHTVGKQQLGKRSVYNIEVEEAHCYYANNILVGNCSGAFKVLNGPDRVFKYYVSSPTGHFRTFPIDQEAFEKIDKKAVEIYGVLFANKDGQIFGATYVYSLNSRKLRQYGEIISPEPISARIAYQMQQKIVAPCYDKPEFASLKKVFCNERMMDYGKGTIAKELKKYGLKLHLNLTYDEPGAVQTVNDMMAENRFIVHSSCKESDVQYRGMRYENKKIPDGNELARCGLILVSQLRAQMAREEIKIAPPYSKRKQNVRETLKSSGELKQQERKSEYDYMT